MLYMAPEQLQGKVYGKVVDWWAVGLLCWEMLTGDNPFYHENPDQIASRVQVSFPQHASSMPHLLAVCRSACATPACSTCARGRIMMMMMLMMLMLMMMITIIAGS